jgi:hypothetical protein
LLFLDTTSGMSGAAVSIVRGNVYGAGKRRSSLLLMVQVQGKTLLTPFFFGFAGAAQPLTGPGVGAIKTENNVVFVDGASVVSATGGCIGFAQ